ncbi:hypothetical protein E0H77_06880 [Acinetobacter sp. ANC 4633]|uniref:hypothetical protein n=1 Tax=Acinetobacter sp. ANC 4633 TaxID=2529845 RepID=UPI00103C3E3E|nr:hypothetical protein [Acinetobacter sp. ANC 4633]TCB26397.1 hypothetical protein E0H77_06880 [Acinetobacter sp. ANC 4633]
MNIMMKTLLSAAALTAFTGVAHAGNQECDTSTGTSSCKDSIPIELTVAKKCVLRADDKITVSASGGSSTASGTGSFWVGANADYNLLVNTTNHAGLGPNASFLKGTGANTTTIPTTVTTTRSGGPSINLGEAKTGEPMALSTMNQYDVKVLTGTIGNVKADTYSDLYTINVYF